jgi:GAF domain-containing protein
MIWRVDAPLPPDEDERLAVLRGLGIMDTPAEERFDRITRIVTEVFRVPIALVGLIDEHRQWYKTCIGLDGTEAARGDTFCQYAILGETTLVVPDAREDPRFRDKPAVTGPPNIRFYAGRPLVVRGQRLGTLCVIDDKPRAFTDADDQMLADLADGWSTS